MNMKSLLTFQSMEACRKGFSKWLNVAESARKWAAQGKIPPVATNNQ